MKISQQRLSHKEKGKIKLVSAADARCFRPGKHVQVQNLPIWSKNFKMNLAFIRCLVKIPLVQLFVSRMQIATKRVFSSFSSSLPVSRSKQQIASYFFLFPRITSHKTAKDFFKKNTWSEAHQGLFLFNSPSHLSGLLLLHITLDLRAEGGDTTGVLSLLFLFFFLREKWRSPKRGEKTVAVWPIVDSAPVSSSRMLRLIPWCCDTCLQKNKKDFSFLGKGVLR